MREDERYIANDGEFRPILKHGMVDTLEKMKLSVILIQSNEFQSDRYTNSVLKFD